MATTWKSNTGRIIPRIDEASRKGLIAAAYVASNAVKERMRGGYTSGDFVTGESINSITRGEPFRTPGGWKIVVGTNLLYNLFWELGHMNTFLNRFVRVEHWRLAMIDSRKAQQEAFTRVFKQTMGTV